MIIESRCIRWWDESWKCPVFGGVGSLCSFNVLSKYLNTSLVKRERKWRVRDDRSREEDFQFNLLNFIETTMIQQTSRRLITSFLFECSNYSDLYVGKEERLLDDESRQSFLDHYLISITYIILDFDNTHKWENKLPSLPSKRFWKYKKDMTYNSITINTEWDRQNGTDRTINKPFPLTLLANNYQI